MTFAIIISKLFFLQSDLILHIHHFLFMLLDVFYWLYAIIYAIFLGAEFNVITADKIDLVFAKLKNKKNKVRLLKENN